MLFYCGEGFAQTATRTKYPKGYFRNPVGIPLEIVSNFGELRPNHWHMGLDIRTNQKENLPIYAAAEGYVASVSIRAQSFGRSIIINHPNGLSTLYAHLNDFSPELEQWVTEQQYKLESWAVELEVPAGKFPVSKGQYIANSGNTGGSQGPHLHFEIIDTKTSKRLNPLLFDFPIPDKIAPDLVKLAMYDRSRPVFEQTPQFFILKKTDSGYIIPKVPMIKTGFNKVSFAIQAYDRFSGTNNSNGIYAAELYLDNQPQVSFRLDSIDYTETAYMNAHIDYRYRYNGGAFFQHLSKMPGDNGPVYRPAMSEGVIGLNDTLTHQISVDVSDTHGNVSQLNFLICYDNSLANNPIYPAIQSFIPNEVNILEKPFFEIYLPENCIYDTIRPVYYYKAGATGLAYSGVHQFNDPSVPIQEDITVRIKPDREIPSTLTDKLIILRSGRTRQARPVTLQDGWVSAKFGDFGMFQVFADNVAPTINSLGKADTVDLSPASRILFTPADNFGIKNFRAELNGQWLRFTNDKSRNWIYIFDERVPYGTHHLKVTVTDLVGNASTSEWWFKRGPYTPPKKKAIKKSSSKKKKVVKKAPVKKTTTKKRR